MTGAHQITVPPGWIGIAEWSDHVGKRVPERSWRPLKSDEQIPARATALRVRAIRDKDYRP